VKPNHCTTKLSSYKPTFGDLAEVISHGCLHYHATDGNETTARSITMFSHYLAMYMLPRWGNVIAEEMTPVAISDWLSDLRRDSDCSTFTAVATIMWAVFDLASRSGICVIPNPMNEVKSVYDGEDKEILGAELQFVRRFMHKEVPSYLATD
jgi:hypothetical protein